MKRWNRRRVTVSRFGTTYVRTPDALSVWYNGSRSMVVAKVKVYHHDPAAFDEIARFIRDTPNSSAR